jgi:signal transduction histidine kinase
VRVPRVSIPITLTSAVVTLTVVLYLVWQVLVAREIEALAGRFTRLHWGLIALGTLFFTVVISWMILQAVWLVREMRTNQRQQNFIDAVTHELHTPLASLQLYLDTLRGQEVREKERNEFLGIMSDDLARLRRTIDQILNAARVEVRRALRDPIDLRALLGECIEEACARYDATPEAFFLDVPPGATLRGDPEQLRVLFRNLIDNAVRYAGERVHVDLAARAVSARRLQVAVTDHGVGIPPFLASRLFQRFARFSHDRLRSTRAGLGLGLYIVRNIARAHGGHVSAQSEGVGTGTRFLVTLPGYIDGSTANPAR